MAMATLRSLGVFYACVWVGSPALADPVLLFRDEVVPDHPNRAEDDEDRRDSHQDVPEDAEQQKERDDANDEPNELAQ